MTAVLLAAFALVVGALAAAAAGGRLRNLRDVRVRVPLLPVLCLAALVALPRIDLPHPRAVLTASWVVLVVFAAVNVRAVRGMWLVLLGVTANLVVVAVNGTLPYRPAALEAAEVFPDRLDAPLHADVVTRPEKPDDRVLLLARRIPVAPFHTVVSAGDVALAAGLGLVVFQALTPPLPADEAERTRRGRRRRPGRRVPRLRGSRGRHTRRGTAPAAVRPTATAGETAITDDGRPGADEAWTARRRLALLTDDPTFLTAGAEPERPGPAAPAVMAAAAVRQALATHRLRADGLFGEGSFAADRGPVVTVDLTGHGTRVVDAPTGETAPTRALESVPRVVIDLGVGHDADRAPFGSHAGS